MCVKLLQLQLNAIFEQLKAKGFRSRGSNGGNLVIMELELMTFLYFAQNLNHCSKSSLGAIRTVIELLTCSQRIVFILNVK